MTSRPDPGPDPRPLPPGALPGRLIVCERSGKWAVALRAARAACPPARRGGLPVAPDGVRVYETRSLSACWQLLAGCPSSFVVAELTASGAEALVDRLVDTERFFPWARVAVVAERSLAAYEVLVREAGAVHFVTTPRDGGPLARLACRHLSQAAEPRRSVTETIWAGLPWGKES